MAVGWMLASGPGVTPEEAGLGLGRPESSPWVCARSASSDVGLMDVTVRGTIAGLEERVAWLLDHL